MSGRIAGGTAALVGLAAAERELRRREEALRDALAGREMLIREADRLASLRQETSLDCILEGDLTLSADQAIPAALMVSELLTNSLRHAYPPGARGTIIVSVKNAGGVLIVTLANDGVGIPDAA